MPRRQAYIVRFSLVLVYISVLAYYFWTSSRYPALNEKALMAGATPTIGLGFDEKFQIDEGMVWFEQIFFNTLNWMYTNKQGMIFGILFATGLLMLFSLLKKKTFKNRFLNAGVGMILGAPLGVCVNCAAPIAQGMRKGGAGVETSLATMTSSPTLNVVVLGMLFSLFPWYMVGVKLVLTFVFILLVIPLIGTLFPVVKPIDNTVFDKIAEKSSTGVDKILKTDLPEKEESFLGSLKWFVIRLLKSLWYLIKMTIPLMLLAGLLGNILITFLPWEMLGDYIPASLTTSRLTIGIVILILGAVGLFLPVPMAFDIIICAILIAAGIPEYYVMVLLFTLGIFSIYSFFIVKQAISFKIAMATAAALVFMGVLGGLATKELGQWNAEREIRALMEVLSSDIKGPEIVEVDNSEKPQSQQSLTALLEKHRLSAETVYPPDLPKGIGIQGIPFYKESQPSKDAFEKISGAQIGLGINKEYPTYFMIIGKLSSSQSLASGDIHQDGWQDLAVVSTGNLFLFANVGGQFVRQDFPSLDSLELVTVALVDMNNDAWLDVVITTEGKGNYYYLNDSGDFAQSQAHRLPNTENAWLTRPMAFADFDRDNDLDVVFGNYTVGNHNRIVAGIYSFPKASRNALLINEGDRYRLSELPTTIIGESLASLWSDINNDGWMDLIEGNDFSPPDVFFLNKNGQYDRPVTKTDGIIETSTESTMSIISGDLNNDLKPEILLAQIALEGMRGDELLSIKKDQEQICSQLDDPIERETCKKYFRLLSAQKEMTMQKKAPLNLGQTNFEFLAILNNIILKRMTCDEIPSKWNYLKAHCKRVMESDYNTPSREEISEAIASQPSTENVLLQTDEAGRFKNSAKDWGIAVGGYAWNAKFADLNADEYLDLYMVNGSHIDHTRQNNFLYMNQGGDHFTNKIGDYDGLNSLLATQTYTLIDIDNDGDQDIISLPAIGPPTAHINQMKKGKTIAFELRDGVGNVYGIGSKVIIHYGENGEKHQVRELLASGGHLSYDPYIAYFGLGEYDFVKKVTIQWSTGEETTLEKSFMSGARYIIHRD